MKRYFRMAGTAATMVLAMVLFTALTMRLTLHAGEVTVPSFGSMSVNQASDAALRTGLDLDIASRQYSLTVPAGLILSQTPAAGSRVRKQWQVRVVESLGPQQVNIPDVTGQGLREASMNLRRNQLDLGMTAHLDAPGDPDIVLAQTPPPDAGVDQPRVSLLLSSAGSGASSAFVLPSFVGMSYAQASHAAAALGLRTSIAGQSVDAAPAATTAPGLPPGAHAGPNGTLLDASGEPIALPATQAAAASVAEPSGPSGPVLAQSPDSGFRANRGDTVRLTFAHVAAPPTPAATPPAAPSPAPIANPAH